MQHYASASNTVVCFLSSILSFDSCALTAGRKPFFSTELFFVAKACGHQAAELAMESSVYNLKFWREIPFSSDLHQHWSHPPPPPCISSGNVTFTDDGKDLAWQICARCIVIFKIGQCPRTADTDTSEEKPAILICRGSAPVTIIRIVPTAINSFLNKSNITCLKNNSISNGEKVLLTGHEDGVVKFWRVTNTADDFLHQQLITTLISHTSTVTDISFGTRGKVFSVS